MHHIASPKAEIHLPLFVWANRHRAKPFTRLTSWSIDRNLNVLKVQVRS